MSIKKLNIKIYADGADFKSIKKLANNDLISGFTTNPTLMRKSGVTDYKKFALNVLKVVEKKPISFEIFADEFDQMYNQAITISKWSENVNVKIPISNTKGQSSIDLIRDLSKLGVKLNITAVFTMKQIEDLSDALNLNTYSIVSVFAGRIADTGVDPIPMMKQAKSILNKSNIDLLWASPREILNIFQAEECGTDIITLTIDMLNKLENIGKSLNEFSLETVQMFYNDAKLSSYKL